MDIVAIVGSAEMVVTAVASLIAAATALYGAYQRARAGKLSASWTLTEDALLSVVAAIEAAPDTAKIKEVKALARGFAEQMNAESPKLREIVKQVEDAFSAWNVAGLEHMDAESLQRVQDAVAKARVMRKGA